MTAAVLGVAPGSGLQADLEAARAAVSTALEVAPAAVGEDELEAAIVAAAALESQTQALKLLLASEAERRHLEARTADTAIEACLARLTGERREMLRGGLLLSRLLQERYQHTLQALAAGDIRTDQARVIVHGLEVSADEVPEPLRTQAEEQLVQQASGVGRRSGLPMPVPQLRRAARHAYSRIDHDVHRAHLHKAVTTNERRARSNTWLQLHDNGDGSWSGRFTIPDLHGSLLNAAVNNLSSPRRCGRDRAGHQVAHDTADYGLYDWQGLALCELIEHLPTDGLARSAISLLVHIDHSTLAAAVADAGVATTDTGVDLSPAEARRLACNAGIIPAVLGGAGQVLDLGRTRRLHTTKQRQALALTYDTCAIAGCDRPFAWTEIHHLRPWAEGGRTDLTNAVPLCWPHHRYAEDPDYELIRHDDREWALRRVRRRPRAPTDRITYFPARGPGS